MQPSALKLPSYWQQEEQWARLLFGISHPIDAVMSKHGRESSRTVAAEASGYSTATGCSWCCEYRSRQLLWYADTVAS